MVSINNAYGVADTTNISSVSGQAQSSPPMFSGENLSQPTQDGFVSTQPQEKESFYQRNKGLIWGVGLLATAGAAFFGHKAYKVNKTLSENVKKITENVEKFDTVKLNTDVEALRKASTSDAKQVYALYDLKDSKNKEFLGVFDEFALGHCNDASHAVVRYVAEGDKKARATLLKLYKTGDVDQSVKTLLGDKGCAVIP